MLALDLLRVAFAWAVLVGVSVCSTAVCTDSNAAVFFLSCRFCFRAFGA
jgi:hypothetical protein